MSDTGQPGIVVARFNKNLTIEDQNGTLMAAVARKKLPPLVCGDHIRWQTTDNDQAVIIALEQRQTLLARPDQRGRHKPVAANITQMIIVSAIDKNEPLNFNDSLIDHYLITAETLHIKPVILINKIDLVDTTDLNHIYNHFRLYQHIGYPILYVSSHQNRGYDELRQQLHQHTSIFVGESGVGKSSLINDLLPEHELRIGQLSSLSGKGMHTTTTTTLYHLTHGGDLIDSPGVREFGLTLQDSAAIAEGFREFHDYIGQCKFRNCRHLGEQGCAICAASKRGDIQQRRLASYQAMVADLG